MNNKKTILFLYSSEIVAINGGVERVTTTLTESLEKCGYKVLYLSLCKKKEGVQNPRQYYIPDNINSTRDIDEFYRNFIIKYGINIVINQGAILDWVSTFACRNKIPDVKLISVLHNAPLGVAANFKQVSSYKLKNIKLINKLLDTKIFKYILLHTYRVKHYKHYNDMYLYSDAIVVLSENFFKELRFLLCRRNPKNIYAIPNPSSYAYSNIISPKNKEILYVGRINTSQKKIDYLLEIWDKLANKYSNWSLHIVGGGDELDSMIDYSRQLRLKNIYFHGQNEPSPFYKTAAIFCLTSSYEGLPLVLIEAMQEGVVPIAFNSFLSVTDIIDNQVNGFLIAPFNKDEYVRKLELLMTNENLTAEMSLKARKKSEFFSIQRITDKWIDLFDTI